MLPRCEGIGLCSGAWASRAPDMPQLSQRPRLPAGDTVASHGTTIHAEMGRIVADIRRMQGQQEAFRGWQLEMSLTLQAVTGLLVKKGIVSGDGLLAAEHRQRFNHHRTFFGRSAPIPLSA